MALLKGVRTDDKKDAVLGITEHGDKVRLQYPMPRCIVWYAEAGAVYETDVGLQKTIARDIKNPIGVLDMRGLDFYLSSKYKKGIPDQLEIYIGLNRIDTTADPCINDLCLDRTLTEFISAKENGPQESPKPDKVVLFRHLQDLARLSLDFILPGMPLQAGNVAAVPYLVYHGAEDKMR